MSSPALSRPAPPAPVAEPPVAEPPVAEPPVAAPAAPAVTLPTAWRGGSADGVAARVRVDTAGLVPGLDRLAAAAGTGRATVLLAAHLAVLGMLGPDPAAVTAVHRADGARAVPVPRRRGTWLDLVTAVDLALQAGPSPVPGGDVRYDDGPGDQPFEGPDGEPPAALVVVRDGEGLELVAAGRDVARPHLDRLADLYRAVLEAMAAGPTGDARPALLPPGERDLVLGAWACGPAVPQGEATVLDVVRARAVAAPDDVAVRTAGGDLTYRELDERSDRMAHHLIDLGVTPESLVGVCLRRGPDLVPALLGVWKAGAAYLPLDPNQPAARTGRILAAAAPPVVVTAGEHVPLLSAAHGGDLVLVDGDREWIAERPAVPPGVAVRPGNLAYVMHTSGSTGAPKGVLVQHGGLLNYLRWTVGAYAARGTGGAPVFSSIAFDLGIPDLFTPLLTGEAAHLLPDPFEVADLGRLLAEGGPYSFVKLTPGHLDLLTHQLTAPQVRDLAGLVVAAGDAFPRALVARWLELAGPGGTGLATEYGPTEITVGNSGEPVLAPPTTDLVPLGVPIPNTTMYVLGPDLEPVPVGVVGEVHIGGAGVARGYLGRPDLTADRFLPDPYGPPGSRLYRTGDLARRLPDGTCEFLGRVDDQVKIRGFRIEPGEVQAVLTGHPAVRDAVVLTHPGPGGTAELVAFVVPAAAGPDGGGADGGGADGGGAPDGIDPGVLRGHLARNLPEYMVPRTVRSIDAIPLTGNGKVDHRALRGLL